MCWGLYLGLTALFRILCTPSCLCTPFELFLLLLLLPLPAGQPCHSSSSLSPLSLALFLFPCTHRPLLHCKFILLSPPYFFSISWHWLSFSIFISLFPSFLWLTFPDFLSSFSPSPNYSRCFSFNVFIFVQTTKASFEQKLDELSLCSTQNQSSNTSAGIYLIHPPVLEPI